MPAGRACERSDQATGGPIPIFDAARPDQGERFRSVYACQAQAGIRPGAQLALDRELDVLADLGCSEPCP
jgi:hypothetical protein